MTKILAFETSCDDTAAAIVDESGVVHAEAIFSQIKEHAPFLGVVPEIGSRAHIEQILHVTKALFVNGLCIADIDAVAATFAPGLIGPLLVGAQFAKGLALAMGKPLIAVHHIEGHIFSGWMDEGFPHPPFIALIASGGHTSIFLCDEKFNINKLGETLDDAAGEAFDKIGRALGLGYPGGKAIDELARQGDRRRFALPIALKDDNSLNFSFSGLKTSAIETIRKHMPFDRPLLCDFCASLEDAIASPLSERTLKAAERYRVRSIVLGGGVMANTRIRQVFLEKTRRRGLNLYLPNPRYCTDNAVMIGKAAHIRFAEGKSSDFSIDVRSQMSVEKSADLLNRFG